MTDSTDKNKKMKLASILISIVLFLLVNVALAYTSKSTKPILDQNTFNSDNNDQPKNWPWWLAKNYLQQATSPDVVLFGSSQMGSATATADAQKQFKIVDPVIDRKAVTLEAELTEGLQKPINVFSLATPGCMISDSYMMSRALFREGLKPKVVIIGVSPRDFIDSTMPYPGATEIFRYFASFIDISDILQAAYTDVFSLMQYGYDHMPIRKFGLQLASQFFPAQKKKDKLQNITVAPAKNDDKGALFAIVGANGEVLPGQWRVPANIPPIWVDNTREYKNRFKTPKSPSYRAEFTFFNKLLAFWQNNNIKVIVVAMPSLPQNRALLSNNFWNKFRQDLSENCSQHQALFCDLSDAPVFEKSDYLDTVHLNASGGFKLFRLIGQYVISTNPVRICLTEPYLPRENKSIAVKSVSIH